MVTNYELVFWAPCFPFFFFTFPVEASMLLDNWFLKHCKLDLIRKAHRVGRRRNEGLRGGEREEKGK